jgi:Sulfotransferase domain
MAAYPNAKVILNTRDPDKWLASMEKTFYVLMSWKSIDFLGPWDPVRSSPQASPFNAPFFQTDSRLGHHRSLILDSETNRQYLDQKRHV